MPDLSGATEWLNSQPTDLRLAGRPALVYFWSVSCSICYESMPKLAGWRSLYGPSGLRLVAIHVPRQEQDTDVAGVRAAIEALQIDDPCGVDNRHAVKAAFAATYLPAYFLFDHEGRLRARAGGEAGLGLLEQPLRRLFAANVALSEPLAPGYLTVGLQ
jgi:thiol-disulfide isomerase/thioredoxin